MDPRNINKYLYIEKTPTWLIRTVYSIGLLTWVSILYGYINFAFINPLFFALISPIIGFLFVYHVVSYGIMLWYKQFDLVVHRTLVKEFDVKTLSNNGENFPLVDIFVPICGEDTDVIRNTFEAVSKLAYPNFKVYVLDDRGDSEHRSLSHHYQFIYMSRDNKGEMKKAGNIKHGFERSNGEFIAVFDADFAPHHDFIKELLPYMHDPKVGIVQSPQYFQTDRAVHTTSALQYGAAHVQEDFYRFIQVARSRLGAPICCGSNAVYRRAALDTIGGTVQIEHSEDAYTGFELINQGYRVIFIPIILAIGLCPDNFHSFFHQQHRWCSGSISMMLDKGFWSSHLSWVQKMCFISGYMYYLSHPVTLLISFQTFIVLYLYCDTLNLMDALPFLPAIFFSFVVIPMIRITPMRFGSFLARNAYLYAYTHAVVVAFLHKSVVWQPTNTKRDDVSQSYLEQLQFVSVYFLIYMVLFAFSIGAETIDIFNIQSYSLLFWLFYNSISTFVILVYLYLMMDSIKAKKITTIVDRFSHLIWRMRTGGVYMVAFGILVVTAGSYGSAVGEERTSALHQARREGSTRLASTATVKPAVSPVPDERKASPDTPGIQPIKVFSFAEQYDSGDSGKAVKELQQFLNDNGYVLAEAGEGAPGTETEYFGPKTLTALRHFQQDHDLLVTGSLDDETRAFIDLIYK